MRTANQNLLHLAAIETPPSADLAGKLLAEAALLAGFYSGASRATRRTLLAQIAALLAPLRPEMEGVAELRTFLAEQGWTAAVEEPAPAKASAPVVASEEPAPLDVDDAEVALTETREALAAAHRLVADLRTKREASVGKHGDAKTAYAQGPTPAAWKAVKDAAELEEQLGVQVEIAASEAARLTTSVAEQEEAILSAQHVDAKRRIAPAAIDAALAQAVEVRARAMLAEKDAAAREEAIVLEVCASLNQAIADRFTIGAKLGIGRHEVEAELQRLSLTVSDTGQLIVHPRTLLLRARELAAQKIADTVETAASRTEGARA